MPNSLRKKTEAGIKWTAIASLILVIGSLVLLALIARKLDNSDFGLMAIVNILTVFSVELVDMGIGQAIIQKQQATKLQLSSLFWVNLSLGIFVCFGLYSIAPLVSDFYGDKELIPLIQIISVVFIFNGFSSQFQAIFQRDFKFQLIAIIDVISFTCYFILTLALVYMDYGVYALIWGSLSRGAIRGVLLFVFGSREHLPGFSFSLKEIRAFLNFGAFRFGAFILIYFNKKLDSLLIGKLLGIDALGVYDIYQRVLEQPTKIFSPIINKVTFPLFAKINNDKNKSKEIFLRVFNMLNSLKFPIFIFLIVAAELILNIFLGEKWLENILVFKVLSLFMVFRNIGAFTGTVMVAGGKANWSLYVNLVMFFITPACIYFGSKYLMIGIAVSMLTVNVLTQIPRYLLIVRRILPLNAREYSKVILTPLLLSCFAGIISYPLTFLPFDELYLLFLMGICFGGTYIFGTYLMNKSILLELNELLLVRFRKKIAAKIKG